MLELAILGFLKDGPVHGYELKQHITQLTGHFRPLSDGALYPAIARLEKQGLLVKKEESGENGVIKRVMTLTASGEQKLFEMLRTPSDIDISDRNRFFTLLAFLRFLSPGEQHEVLQKRLHFLEGGRSFFSKHGAPVKMADESDVFRRGMQLIARETSRVERQWLKDTMTELAGIIGNHEH